MHTNAMHTFHAHESIWRACEKQTFCGVMHKRREKRNAFHFSAVYAFVCGAARNFMCIQ